MSAGAGTREMGMIPPTATTSSTSGSSSREGRVEAFWRDQAVLDGSATRAFAVWWVKTLLLTRHPNTRQTFPGLARAEPLRPATAPGRSDPLLPYLRGAELLPPDLSLWLALSHSEHGTQDLDDACTVALPTVSLGALPALLRDQYRSQPSAGREPGPSAACPSSLLRHCASLRGGWPCSSALARPALASGHRELADTEHKRARAASIPVPRRR